MINNQLKIIKKKMGLSLGEKTHCRVSTGFYRVAEVTGQTGGSIKFCQVFAHPDLLSCPT
jgi:hypothetical protein